MKLLTLITVIILSTYIHCRAKEEWKTRSIYQILTVVLPDHLEIRANAILVLIVVEISEVSLIV